MTLSLNSLQLCAVLSCLSVVEVVVSVGEVVPDTKYCISQIQLFVNTNGSSGSNFNTAVFSCNLKKNWAYKFL